MYSHETTGFITDLLSARILTPGTRLSLIRFVPTTTGTVGVFDDPVTGTVIQVKMDDVLNNMTVNPGPPPPTAVPWGTTSTVASPASKPAHTHSFVIGDKITSEHNGRTYIYKVLATADDEIVARAFQHNGKKITGKMRAFVGEELDGLELWDPNRTYAPLPVDPVCTSHEFVNIGFTTITMACKHCGVDQKPKQRRA